MVPFSKYKGNISDSRRLLSIFKCIQFYHMILYHELVIIVMGPCQHDVDELMSQMKHCNDK